MTTATITYTDNRTLPVVAGVVFPGGRVTPAALKPG